MADNVALKLLLVVLIYGGVSILVVRFQYRRGLMAEIGRLKKDAQHSFAPEQLKECEAVMASDVDSPAGWGRNQAAHCTQICELARQVAKTRQVHMQQMREEYWVAGFMAEIFDFARGMPVSPREEMVMKNKPCARVLDHVDHSNKFVDFSCAGLLVVAYLVTLNFMGLAVCSKLFNAMLALIAIEEDPLYALAGGVLTALLPQFVQPVYDFYEGCYPIFEEKAVVVLMQMFLLCGGVVFLIVPPSGGSISIWATWGLQKLISVCGLLEAAGLVIEHSKTEEKIRAAKAD